MQRETLIDKIDNSLASKKNTEVLFLFIIVVAVIGIFSYYFIIPITEDFYNLKQRALADTTNKLNTAKTYNINNENVPNSIKNNIAKIEKKLEDTRYINNFVDFKLKELSYLMFNDRTWASFMDRITSLAKKHNVQIIRIENDFTDEKNKTKEKVEQVLNIDVEFDGSFQNIMKFVNGIEESQLVVDASKLYLVGSRNGVDGNVSISIWGMLYNE